MSQMIGQNSVTNPIDTSRPYPAMQATEWNVSASAPAARRRRTVAREIVLSGTGLHSGNTVSLRMIPADGGTGLIFRSSDRQLGEIPVTPYNVVNTLNAVTLANRTWHIQTVEHLLAALATAGITDLIMELDSNEIPILDGSSQIFYDALVATGWTELNATLEPIRLTTPVWVVEGDKYLVALPDDRLKVTYHIDYNHPLLKGQSLHIELNERVLAEEDILPARTFGFLRDVEMMKSKGLIKGGSVDNAIVLTEDGFLNESLRFPEECIRHKVLDLIGDMYLLGRPLEAHLIASKAGHGLDVMLARKILTSVSMDELARMRGARPEA